MLYVNCLNKKREWFLVSWLYLSAFSNSISMTTCGLCLKNIKTRQQRNILSIQVLKEKLYCLQLLEAWLCLSCSLWYLLMGILLWFNHVSHVQLFATTWAVAHQAPLSMGFSRQEYWSGLPFPSGARSLLLIDQMLILGVWIRDGSRWQQEGGCSFVRIRMRGEWCTVCRSWRIWDLLEVGLSALREKEFI